METSIIKWIEYSCNGTSLLLDTILILSLSGHYISYDELINNNNEIIIKNLKSLKNDNEITFQSNNSKINIIIENNLKHSKNKIQSKPETTTTTTTTEELFFKVIRNAYLWNQIKSQIRLYNIHYNHQMELSPEQLYQYKHRDYLRSIRIKKNEGSNKNELFIFKGLIPDGVEIIVFDQDIDPVFEKNCFPDSVTSLDLGLTKFNGELSREWLPINLKEFYLGLCFNKSITSIDQFPIKQSLEKLVLSKKYNGLITPGSIPQSALKSLHYKFDSQGNNILIESNVKIPKYCTSLEFDDDFDQTLKLNYIPQNVTSIKFGYQMNSAILGSGILPKNLDTLKFGSAYNHGFGDEMVLPDQLKTLKFKTYFDRELHRWQLPNSLTSISFGSLYNQSIQDVLNTMPNLKTIKFSSYGYFNRLLGLNSLPVSLTSLNLGRSYNHPLADTLVTCTPNLVHLQIDSSYSFSISINSFPSSLKSLIVPGKLLKRSSRNGTVVVLPNSIESLVITSTVFGDDDDEEDNNINGIEDQIERVKLDLSLPNSLPSSLTKLDIQEFNVKFNIETLPQSLTSILSSNSDTDYIQSLDSNLFIQYFKFK